jgi:hypothetical protein
VSIGNDSRLSFPSNLTSPQRSPFPSLVTPPASDATEVVGYTLPFISCQEENTLTIEPYAFHSLWKNLWKTLIKTLLPETLAKHAIYRACLLRFLQERAAVKLAGLKNSVQFFCA